MKKNRKARLYIAVVTNADGKRYYRLQRLVGGKVRHVLRKDLPGGMGLGRVDDPATAKRLCALRRRYDIPLTKGERQALREAEIRKESQLRIPRG